MSQRDQLADHACADEHREGRRRSQHTGWRRSAYVDHRARAHRRAEQDGSRQWLFEQQETDAARDTDTEVLVHRRSAGGGPDADDGCALRTVTVSCVGEHQR